MGTKTVILTGLLVFCTSKGFAMNAMEAFKKTEETSENLLAMQSEQSKIDQIQAYIISELARFEIEASEKIDSLVIDFEWVATSREEEPEARYYQYFSAYVWAGWQQDGRSVTGTCKLRSRFAVSQNESRMETVEEAGRSKLRIMILNPSVRLQMSGIQETPLCHEI